MDKSRKLSRVWQDAPFLFRLLLVGDCAVGLQAFGYALFRLGESGIDPALLELAHSRVTVGVIGILALGQAAGVVSRRPYGLALYLAPCLFAYVAIPLDLLASGISQPTWVLANMTVATFVMLVGWLNRRWFGIGPHG